MLQASPLDGGTDNGFTFTSPNWATQPQDAVFTITSDYPAHPAGSFNYPHLNRLPTIAVYKLTKVGSLKPLTSHCLISTAKRILLGTKL